jgi:agmatine deiminase
MVRMNANQKRSQSPRELGYQLPAEWEPHAATWLSWPHRKAVSFPGKFEPVPAYWVRICELVSPHEHVHVNVRDESHGTEVRRLLAKSKNVRKQNVFLHRFGTNDCWCRDHGPIFIKRQNESAVVDWRFNAWGGKYPKYALDDAIPKKVAKLLGLPLFSPKVVLEGGSLDVNGQGTLLTTESCLLNKNRNPHLTRKQIEQHLKDYLGVTNILWLGEGIVGDDTDGHVDDITRFVNPTTVVTAIEDDPKDANHKALRENLARLKKMKDQDGKPLRIVTLPMPGVVEHNGKRLPASYANFYIANKIVLVPIYSHKNDKRALAILQRCFSTRKVVGIESTDLIWGLGAFHCVTQQQPAV